MYSCIEIKVIILLVSTSFYFYSLPLFCCYKIQQVYLLHLLYNVRNITQKQHSSLPCWVSQHFTVHKKVPFAIQQKTNLTTME